MQYIDFRNALRDFTVFSLSDIKKVEPDFYRRRLSEWQNKGYIKKIIRGYYIFSELVINENILFEIANRIYVPSYVSLEMAMAYYHLIPESVYTVTSVSTKRTFSFNTQIAKFTYRTIKPSLFFGYNIQKYNHKGFKIASMEKTVLDFFYLSPSLQKNSDFVTLRINKELFFQQVDENKLYYFLDKFHLKSLEKRIYGFMRYMKNA